MSGGISIKQGDHTVVELPLTVGVAGAVLRSVAGSRGGGRRPRERHGIMLRYVFGRSSARVTSRVGLHDAIGRFVTVQTTKATPR